MSQFSEKFKSISVDNKIPIIYDHNEKIYIRESGIILMYLADKFGKFIPSDENRVDTPSMANVANEFCRSNFWTSTSFPLL